MSEQLNPEAMPEAQKRRLAELLGVIHPERLEGPVVLAPWHAQFTLEATVVTMISPAARLDLFAAAEQAIADTYTGAAEFRELLAGAGELPEPNAWAANPAEFAALWNQATPEGRAIQLPIMQAAQQRGAACYVENHVDRIARQEIEIERLQAVVALQAAAARRARRAGGSS